MIIPNRVKPNFLYLILLFILPVLSASAQILNDSSQTIYGTKTTKTYLEEDFLRGNYTLRRVDTALTNMHQSRNWYHDTTFHQDLGNVGTAGKPILWRFPQKIGVRLGKNAFDRYAYQSDKITYFDTKSPYTHLFYIQGGQGEQVFEAKHSRSLSKKANIGFAFERMSGEKQFGIQPGLGKETQTQHTGFVLFTHLQDSTGKYHLFSNYIHVDHDLAETGGLRIGSEATRDSLFGIFGGGDAPVWLSQAANEEKRNSFHLTQFYTLAKEYIKVFHTLDFRHQYNKYFDNQVNRYGATKPPLLYPAIQVDSTRTDDRSWYRELENTVGITGNHPLFVYKLYARRRDASINLNTRSQIDPIDSTRVTEGYRQSFGQNFIGGETQFRLKDIFNISVNAEYQLFKDYLATASARVKYFTFSQTRSSYSPTLVQQLMASNHFNWDNNFDNIVADRTAASVQGTLWRNTLTAEVARVNLQNYVIYNTSAVPQQLSKQLSFYTAFVHHHLALKNFHADHVFSYNKLDNAQEIRMPKWLVNSRFYYQGSLFKNALFGQVGVETYVTDSYYADAYMPVTQQFYLQDNFRVPGSNFTSKPYPIVDLFLTVDIKSFNGFVKMSHVNQGYPQEGYFSSPYYPGMGRSFVFGIKWMFFD
ncbi:hypothetical protein AAE02nite_26340 [Adhaeribacter aerolatus]|uniref:Porin n=1 Tax=Adhaeribacter aerolatus TaxID=670289 RepID=A0A512AZ45_9BACT|nr:putative porin [Adhaeribacter aerolatus]GEO04970.1 hypothetical protein AAE02nite_26340 [Adhaeribacter aerolatus]